MAYDKSTDINEERIAAFLRDAASKVEHASNSEIDELKAVSKLFKRNVGLSKRSYVAAYIIRSSSRFFKDAARRERRTEAAPDERREERASSRPAPAPQQARGGELQFGAERHPNPPDSKQIFISVGKQRKVFARDIERLVSEIAGIDKSHIGRIKTLPAYSFVNVSAEDCDAVIAALNGYEYRGQPLTVSYARRRAERPDAAQGTKPERAKPAAQPDTAPAESAPEPAPAESPEAPAESAEAPAAPDTESPAPAEPEAAPGGDAS